MLPDPLAATISGTAISFPKIDTRARTNVYFDRATNTTLYVTQDVSKKGDNRASVSIVRSELFTDPVSGVKSMVPTAVNVAFTIPVGGSTTTAEALYVGITNALEATSNALLKRILAGER